MKTAQELQDLLGSLRQTDIEELTLENGSSRVFFRRSDVMPAPAPAAVAAPAHVVEHSSHLRTIRAPMVGTFFHSQSVDHPPFVIEGNHVVPGQKIGIIEAMKIIKDVSSDLKGKIVKVSVKNGQPVEYGQELFQVDTEPETV